MSRVARKIFIAEDDQGRRHAGVYMVWDENSAYYLMGGGDPALRNGGAASLCMWEAVKYASTVARSFDFEGSMLESVERFFRGGGAVQMPYFSVWKTPRLCCGYTEQCGTEFPNKNFRGNFLRRCGGATVPGSVIGNCSLARPLLA
jgi:hypothetical protein